MMNFLKTLQRWGREVSNAVYDHISWVNLVCGFWALGFGGWSLHDAINRSHEMNDPIPWYLIVAYVFMLGVAIANFWLFYWIRVRQSDRSVRWDICKTCGHEKLEHVGHASVKRYLEAGWTVVRQDNHRCAVWIDSGLDDDGVVVIENMGQCSCEQYRRKWLPTKWPVAKNDRNFVYNL